MSPDIGRALMAAGAFIFCVGLYFVFRDRLPGGLSLLGKLPGDIAIEKEHFRFYFPLTTSILISLALTFLFWILRK